MPRACPASFNSLEAAGPAAAAHPMATAASLRSSLELAVFENLAEVESAWRAFEREADCTVFQSFDWLDTWQRHIGVLQRVRPAIVIGRQNGDILFILPLATRRAGFARELVFLGSELCDYNVPLLASQFSAAMKAAQFDQVWPTVLACLRAAGRRFDLIRLEKMPPKVGAQENPMLSLGVTLNASGAYATGLTGDWDTFYAAKRSSSTRSRDRSKRKRMAELGAVAFVQPQGDSETLATLDMLIAQKSRAFARMGVSNIFTRPGHLDFYRALATSAPTRGMVHISRLDCGAETAAVNIGLVFRDTYYHLQASHDDGTLSRFGPGAAHLHELLRHAIERGLKVYDFTIGDEGYKRDWCDSRQDLYDHLGVASVRGTLVFAPLAGLSRLKRLIKQTPVLWDAFQRVRSTLRGASKQ